MSLVEDQRAIRPAFQARSRRRVLIVRLFKVKSNYFLHRAKRHSRYKASLAEKEKKDCRQHYQHSGSLSLPVQCTPGSLR